jgi:hypothetical protein
MRRVLVDRFYTLLNSLSETRFNSGFRTLRQDIPNKFSCSGIYFFTDRSIPRDNAHGYKIVRIGITKHAQNNRLRLHKNGNINASVFRKHVYNALNIDGYTPNEIDVSNYIWNLQYFFLPISDENLLKRLEKGLIELISNHGQEETIDPVPDSWLGHQNGPNSNLVISSSNLWNVHYVQTYNNNFNHYHTLLNELEVLINELDN